jgi:TetR/AcrR family transcriptional repressor of lmrAB and yxaGH operons
MSTTKDQFIETTCNLLEKQGYHATGLNQIVKESGAPKGSLYYHFPEGKEELAEEAVYRTQDNLITLIQDHLREDIPIAEAVRDFVFGVAHGVEVTNFQSGGPLTAIAMETATTSERLNRACREAFSQIQAAFAAKLLSAGFETGRVASLSIFITSAIEGGIILSRTHHSGDPLRTVAEELYLMLKEKN